MLALAGNTLLLEPGPHANHPVLGAADVVLCLLVLEVEEVLLLEAGEVDLALKVKGVASRKILAVTLSCCLAVSRMCGTKQVDPE